MAGFGSNFGLFSCCDEVKWKTVLNLYCKALNIYSGKKAKPQDGIELIKLDKWYQTELPEAIKQRKHPHITYDELVKLMKWKLKRGKFRPRLQQLVGSNTEEEVMEASTKAFAVMPDIKTAIQSLAVLRGVGPATASAVLAAGDPEHAAFMADEALQAIPGLQPIAYKLENYLEYHEQIRKCVTLLKRTDDSWNSHMVELALWTGQVLGKLEPECLPAINISMQKRKSTENSTRKMKRNKEDKT
ncbi:PREDICTED: uncharacterized protein LOC106812444 [Priapulus caudatus]|uniref:Uncharacterized protein LOC106812444 n=1 Tax=Priapulus caudatus TaxID=37621 RepID=A0ABM1EHZ4_PRICU|nr:PREDICTED: uncharacterized protein LOC106812444 [Priapulus caudatus]